MIGWAPCTALSRARIWDHPRRASCRCAGVWSDRGTVALPCDARTHARHLPTCI